MPSRPVGDVPRRESTYDRDRQRDGGRGDGRGTGAPPSSRTPADDEDRIGPYLIGEEIGRGSFATVFRGAHYVSWPAALSLSLP